MPFESEKQRRFLWANEPEVAEKWTKEYGSAIRRRMTKNEMQSMKREGRRNVYRRRKRAGD